MFITQELVPRDLHCHLCHENWCNIVLSFLYNWHELSAYDYDVNYIDCLLSVVRQRSGTMDNATPRRKEHRRDMIPMSVRVCV